MGDVVVRVEGLNQVIKGFRKMDRSLAREVQMELRHVVRPVAADARSYARSIGLVESGALARGISPFYRGSQVGIRSTVSRKGYPYGGVYEFGGAYGFAGFGHGGGRPFLWPTVQRDEQKIILAFEDMLDRLTSQAGFGRGGVL